MFRWLVTAVCAVAVVAACQPTRNDSSGPRPAASDTATEPAQPFVFVALGDSLAAGINGDPSYVDMLAVALRRRTGRPVELHNFGQPGLTSDGLLTMIRSDGDVRRALEDADLVTVDIGGNDLLQAGWRVRAGCQPAPACISATVRRFGENWAQITRSLQRARNGDARLLTFDLYAPPGIDRSALAARAVAQVNATIRRTAGTDGLLVAPVAQAFAANPARLLLPDGIHPNAAGHRVIARRLLALVPAA